MAALVARFIAVLLVSAPIAIAAPAQAHRDGCHAAHSCPSDTGSYVCGDKGIATYCGGSSSGGSSPSSNDTYSFVAPDYEAPARPKVAARTSAKGGMITVVISAEAGSKIRVGSGGKELYSGRAIGGRQTITFKGIHGLRTYNVTARDAADNVSDVAKFQVAADAKPPSLDQAVVVLGDAEMAAAQFSVAPGEDASYTLLIDGARASRGKIGAGGKDFLVPIPNGEHRLTLTLTDAVGNEALLEKSVRVDIPKLAPSVGHEAVANSSVQEFVVRGAPGSVGTLVVGDQTKSFTLKNTELSIPLTLGDGEYAAPVVRLRDQFGRQGMTRLAGFVVDTVKPQLAWRDGDDGSFTGKMAALILAEEGARVAWRLLDDQDDVIEQGTYVADMTHKRLVRDVAEGEYVLAVSATDEAGNEISDRFQMRVAPDPRTAGEWAVIAVFLALLFGLLWFAWRRRDALGVWLAEQKRAGAVRQAQRAYDKAVAQHQQALMAHAATVDQHRQAMDLWNRRKDELESMLEEARTSTGSGALVGAFRLIKLKRGERIYSVTKAHLVEERTRQNVPVLVPVEEGRVAVTSERVIFDGGKGRTWEFAKLERIDQPNGATFLFKVSNRTRVSGVIVVESERFRLHIDMALADMRGDRSAVVAAVGQRLHAHNRSMPGDPPPPPSPPQIPALLIEQGTAHARAGR